MGLVLVTGRGDMQLGVLTSCDAHKQGSRHHRHTAMVEQHELGGWLNAPGDLGR
jgi:hypothetical protein